MITIVSGDIDSGKTRYLKKHYEQERKGDGFLSRKHYKDEHCIGYDMYHLKSGKSRAFIRLKTCLPNNWDECCDIGRFSFSEQGMLLAKSILNNINSGPIYIDEIGPIELWFKKGFYNDLKELIKKDIDLYLTLRPTLIQEFHDEFGLSGKTKLITLK